MAQVLVLLRTELPTVVHTVRGRGSTRLCATDDPGKPQSPTPRPYGLQPPAHLLPRGTRTTSRSTHVGINSQTQPRLALQRTCRTPSLNHNSRPYWFILPGGGTVGGAEASRKNQWEEPKLPRHRGESFYREVYSLLPRKKKNHTRGHVSF